MEFNGARPDVVRAINQRWLLKFWKRYLGGHRVPSWQAVDAEDFSRMNSNLSFLDVTGNDGNARFLVRFNGGSSASMDRTTAMANFSTNSFRRHAMRKGWRPIIGRSRNPAPAASDDLSRWRGNPSST